MDGRLTLTWLIFLLVIISFHSLGLVSGTFHENQSDRRKLTAKEGRYSFYQSCQYRSTSHERSSFLKERNCYTLQLGQGKNHKYLIRARFLYGNYDSKNQLPIFKLYLGVDEWAMVNITYASYAFMYEIIHIPISDYIDMSLLLYNRWDFGTQQEKWSLIRDKDDVYDRIWRPFTWWSWLSINSSLVSSSYSTSVKTGFSLNIDDDPSQKLYIYMHFAEVEDLKGQIREFTVSVNDEPYSEPVAPRYLFRTRNCPFLERTNRSTLPPIINAMEAYMIKEFHNHQLNKTMVGSVPFFDAIKRIKSDYAVSRNWQGDPCLPMEYQWDGLTCSHNTSPTIISLNLTGNNLTGSVPQAVTDKFKDGTLSFGENPNLCPSVSCQGQKKKKKKNKFFVPVLTSILSAIVVLVLIAALAIIRKLTKRRETKATTIETVTERPKEGPLKSGNCEFTYSEIVGITNNFNRPIGRGGFGEVYLGTLADDTQVAVKVHSPSSNQGPKAFRAEAKLLTRVHHKNLVRLIGYCDDSTNMVLIYEYMSNGNLQQKLSAREAADVLNWKQRLQIAVDAAHGLEYLHNGCKPPIVHRDMKSSNILLTESLQAKIADFGMSRDLQSLSTDPVGTPGYFDPECQSTGNLNEKSDVYSFGIVLLELITGRRAIIPGGIHIAGWVSPMIERGDIRSIVDPRLQGDFNTNSAWKAVEIALACVASTGMQRPDMSHVVVDLKECLETEVASRRIQRVGGHSIGSDNFLENVPLVLSTEVAPHAR
ncbi:hypothetical protein AAG906_039479 [Vitis piasezkii]